MFVASSVVVMADTDIVPMQQHDPRVHLALVNQVRASRGLNPLVLSSCLQNAAMFHSNYMASIHQMTLFDTYGNTYNLVSAYGQISSSYGINVASGYVSDNQVVYFYSQNYSNLQVLLNPLARELGVGVVFDGMNYYWTTLITDVIVMLDLLIIDSHNSLEYIINYYL
ncbi:hypothetical protein SAMD00019534_097350 [Acytostelium subglobosum LB1]|uniref:hypothetical protein n=1 Tax=Acytostelium subglobosum LB1 TaxID=1410327 RepID=UPI000644BCE4|nr:hypothetical protein SAMD00019534_097350 [Acytostelium subglobosum LB1]GAM26560.1 hypothetical protein SAMD00019534_097350 [Acytostelium subglobosum LB1]|eukprot:XP_012750656.1 hypothetical protein SAMD00019534_097350 [Acytostelium subglobosum LB1]